jgi:hypothetical protein
VGQVSATSDSSKTRRASIGKLSPILASDA